MERAGLIKDLVLQAEFLIQGEVRDPYTHKKLQPIHYIGDFLYVDTATEQRICEETKGFFSEVARVKWKLVIPRYPKIKFVLLHGEDF
jgi:hypothetical protein